MKMLIVLCVLYFVPSIVAMSRHHKNGGAIGIINIFLGWNFIGWVVALAWACTDNVEKKENKK